MNLSEKQKKMLDLFTSKLLTELQLNKNISKTTFGFEIEFLPADIIGIKDVHNIELILPELGFRDTSGLFLSDSGLSVAFEPGGQIEFCSPPIESGDALKFTDLLNQIAETNKKIFNRLSIKYLATDFMPGRADIKLCLKEPRYKCMHKRFKTSGTRGREMMKGTASIHLHAGLRSIDEIPVIYKTLCRLSVSKEFAKSAERKNIWLNTDPTRCGLPNLEQINTPHSVIKSIVHHALCAEDLYKSKPLYHMHEITFDYFKKHLTTIFTDVRLNLKGPTIELRTLDSMPLQKMAEKWRMFTSIIHDII